MFDKLGFIVEKYEEMYDTKVKEGKARLKQADREKSLQILANETKGQYFRATGLKSLVDIYKAIDILDLSCVKTVFLNDHTLKNEYIRQVIEETSGQVLNVDMNYEIVEEKLNKLIIGQKSAISKLMTSLKSLSYYRKKEELDKIFSSTNSFSIFSFFS